eukprot:TRINITY_DN9969_c0_g1_i1.p1 TRINITY_DN9969_c0_g1~~TRINITY_DN9969_c0_g1_i1.p1  ORF type:complete len:134 (+),score=50.07 TRINITY_DN9969_c0_g1_i1:509-910(+)
MAMRMCAEGRGDELMPRAADVAPMTAYRYRSLYTRLADDDMFSSDLTDEELQRILKVGVPTLVVQSAADEYVPDHVDREKQARRIHAACASSCDAGAGGKGGVVVLPGADHGVAQEPAQELFIEEVAKFLSSL